MRRKRAGASMVVRRAIRAKEKASGQTWRRPGASEPVLAMPCHERRLARDSSPPSREHGLGGEGHKCPF